MQEDASDSSGAAMRKRWAKEDEEDAHLIVHLWCLDRANDEKQRSAT